MNETMNERARACYTVHRGACEDWTHGELKKLIRGSESPLFFLYMFSLSPYEKMHRYTSLAEPPEGSLDKACFV